MLAFVAGKIRFGRMSVAKCLLLMWAYVSLLIDVCIKTLIFGMGKSHF